MLADPTMARWFAASMRGLSARRVQGVRVSLPRWCRLHGIGVNRRSFVRSRQRRHVRETHCNSDIQGAWYSTGLEDAVVHGVSAFGDLGAALLATACVLDGCRFTNMLLLRSPLRPPRRCQPRRRVAHLRLRVPHELAMAHRQPPEEGRRQRSILQPRPRAWGPGPIYTSP